MNIQSAINAGLFVQFVYDNWSVPSQTTDLSGRPVITAKGDPIIPGKNYEVLETIYANDMATDLSAERPVLPGYRTVGIVAQNTADPADIVIAIRGTEHIWEWIQDCKFFPRTFPPVHGSGLTEDGFTDMYLSFWLSPAPPPAPTFMATLKEVLPSNAMVTVAGHSLGSALATMLALDMGVNTTFPVVLYTLASPRVGDFSFHNLFEHVVPNAYRIANRMDIVTKTPLPPLYLHVGDETELVPPITLRTELGCEHFLSSYLHMLGLLLDPKQTLYPLEPACTKPTLTVVATGTP